MSRAQYNPNVSSSSGYAETQEYLIELPHTKESCLAALDRINDLGPQTLERWSFGCSDGNHTGYALVDADSLSEALNVVPDSDRKTVKIRKLNKMTPEQIASYHRS
jgi:hypothetical protein